MVSESTWRVHGECAYENKVFVNRTPFKQGIIMVSESTWRVQAVLRFILTRNYNGFVVDMDSLAQVNLHFSTELQWFRGGHGFFSSR